MADQSFEVDEDSPAGAVVGRAPSGWLAADPDAGQTLSYAITAGNLGDTFATGATTAEITVATRVPT